MQALSIAWKDIQIFLKDRGSIALLFLLPLAFIFIFSGALSQIGSEPEDRRIPLPVVNLDPAGASAQTLIDGIDAAGGVDVIPYEQADAETQLEATPRGIDRVLLIPADFSARIAEGDHTVLRLINHPEASATETEAVRLVVDGVAQSMALETQLIASLMRMGEMQAASPGGADAFNQERIINQARGQFAAAQTVPLISISQTTPGQAERDADAVDPFSDMTVRVIGFAVLFVFLTAQSTARSIYDEKKVGSFRRLLAAPIGKFTVLLGKVLPNFLTALMQIAVIFLFGLFVLPLLGMDRISLGGDPLGLFMALLLVALCSSALGILIAALARTEGQIGGLGSLVIWGMGIVGGSFIPLYLFDDPFVSGVGRFVPVHWANQSLVNLMVRDQGLAGVGPELAMLAGFTAVFFLIGLWRFDFD